jgi:hypothetical protein
MRTEPERTDQTVAISSALALFVCLCGLALATLYAIDRLTGHELSAAGQLVLVVVLAGPVTAWRLGHSQR